jgi:hypothetical protein
METPVLGSAFDSSCIVVEGISTSSSGRDLAVTASAVPIVLSSLRVSNFKLEEEGNTALLLLLP